MRTMQEPKWEQTLDRLYGSCPDVKDLTKKERLRIAEEMTPEKSRKILKEFGF